MMVEYKNLAPIKIAFIVLMAFSSSKLIVAQSNTIQVFEEESKAIEDSMDTLKVQLEDLQNQFAKINNEIYQLKTELRTAENPLKRLNLENKLKESLKYADQIKRINLIIEKLNNQLKDNYNKIIEDINQQINLEIQKFNSIDDLSLKASIIEKVNIYEKKKQKYYKLINEEIQTVVEDASIEISPNDNLDRLNLKIDLIKDRLTFLEEEKKYLLKKREELNSDLSMYVEMSDFMKDLRRNIDEEQEFYDYDRAEQIKLKIKNIKIKLKSIKERLSVIDKSKIYYARKLNEFNSYKKSLLFH